MTEKHGRPGDAESTEERPSPDYFERPEVQEGIEEAQRQMREGDVEPGMTSDDLLDVARELRRRRVEA